MTALPIPTDSVGSLALDPNRPFARYLRGDHDIIIEAHENDQWVRDWLNYVGLTAEELIRIGESEEFENLRQENAWWLLKRDLREGRW